MAGLIEDYALIGNCETTALVGRNGSIDWLCLPRFDSAACFAGLLGDDGNGRWLIAPAEAATVSRRYRPGTLILETTYKTKTGTMLLTDVMSRRDGTCDILRRVTGVEGTVAVTLDMVIRFDYGASVPWVSRVDDDRVRYVVGPDRLLLQSSVRVENENMRTSGAFTVQAGEVQDFVLTWSKSYRPLPPPVESDAVLGNEEERWRQWTKRFQGAGDYSDIVLRSLITLKALTHYETGGIIAAATTSLPEQIGGPRNWDYRFCWLRDATLTLYALLECNFLEEADAWQKWLVRAVAGSPDQLQIMYGVAGERRLDEWTISWLPGYENSTPVHIGNAAAGQIQLDVYGEVMDALYFARTKGIASDETAWSLQSRLIEHLKTIWADPDDGLWEQRGGRKQFTHSKVMAWVAVDRAIRSSEEFDLPAPLGAWRVLRDDIHADVCRNGFDPALNSFVQTYGTKNLDAALLAIPLVGFLPADDPRVIGTIAAVEDRLLEGGFVKRYENLEVGDGLPGGEGAFLACSFWLADCYVLCGRVAEARVLFEKLLALCNDVGLLSEEYDPVAKRQIGNFPQAFSHLGLINTAFNLSRVVGPSASRGTTPERADAG